MKIKNKKKWALRDKGISQRGYCHHDGGRYNRAYVKKLDEEITFIPFSKSSKLDLWFDDYYDSRKSNYFWRWMEKQIGKNVNEVRQKFVAMGWYSTTQRDSIWNDSVDDRYLDRYRWSYRYYVDENGIICRYSDHRSKNRKPIPLSVEQWLWNRDNPIPDHICDETFTGMKKLPKKYWIEYNGKILLLSVYLFPTQPDRPGVWLDEYFRPNHDPAERQKIDSFEAKFTFVNVRVNGGYLKYAYVSNVEAEYEWNHTLCD